MTLMAGLMLVGGFALLMAGAWRLLDYLPEASPPLKRARRRLPPGWAILEGGRQKETPPAAAAPGSPGPGH